MIVCSAPRCGARVPMRRRATQPAGSALNTYWSAANPNVSFANSNSTVTTAFFQRPGTYSLTLTANDGQASQNDFVNVVTASDHHVAVQAQVHDCRGRPLEHEEIGIRDGFVRRRIELGTRWLFGPAGGVIPVCRLVGHAPPRAHLRDTCVPSSLAPRARTPSPCGACRAKPSDFHILSTDELRVRAPLLVSSRDEHFAVQADEQGRGARRR